MEAGDHGKTESVTAPTSPVVDEATNAAVNPSHAESTTQPTPGGNRRRFSLSGLIAILALAVVLLGPYVAYLNPIVDTIGNFRWQILFLSIALAIYLALSGRKTLSTVVGVLSVIAAIPMTALYFPGTQPPAGETIVRVVSLNLLESNEDVAAVQNFLAEADADIVCLMEYSPQWEQELSEFLSRYPHSTEPVLGNVIFSRLPLEKPRLTHPVFAPIFYLSAAATTEIDGRRVIVMAFHPTSPTSFERLAKRDAQIRLLAEPVAQLPQWYDVVLVGDFNATTWCRSMRDMIAETGLRDTRQGFGSQSSWPTPFWPAAICIDHQFVSQFVRVHDRTTGPNVGSDHLPVISELSFGRSARKK